MNRVGKVPPPGIGVIGFFSYLPTVIQLSVGLSSFETALLFVAWSGTSFAVALRGGLLARQFPGWALVAAGFAISAVGTATMLGFVHAQSWVRLVPGLVVAGVGSGLVNAQLPKLAVESVPAADAAMGSGANSSARYVGSAIGVAMATAVVGAAGADLGRGADWMLAVSAVMTAVAALAMVALRDKSG